jgi:hypothetical protein
MVIKKITPKWWILTADDGFLGLTFFGESKGEVLGKFNAYIRDYQLESIRYTPKKIKENAMSDTHHNTGYFNTGDYNTGDYNTGNYNTGDCNTGYCNTGDCNTGNYNTGYCNTGNYNTGDYNTGHRNTGDCNTGYHNTGDYNTGDFHVGCFNTVNAETALYFNQPAKIKDWEKAEKPIFIFRVFPTTWVSSEAMSDFEKKEHPEHTAAGGYLRRNDMKEEWAKAYAAATPKDIKLLKALPNFDAKVFLQITGIDVREKQAK